MAASHPQMKLDPKYDDYDYPTTSPTAQTGHPGHTTPEQDAQVHQLRTQLEQAGYAERLDTLSLVSTSTSYRRAWPKHAKANGVLICAATVPESAEIQRGSRQTNVRLNKRGEG